ncbi:hypothetical protein [Streptomyces sp. NPDC058228]|uniref:hypothetical protein n=1 Tax=Streptomyces sp. NPDC058228 TaxID=3346390 RepID=UPI0036E083B2
MKSAFGPQALYAIVYAFLTNGYGVAWNAKPICIELIGRFDGHQTGVALRTFANPKVKQRLPGNWGSEKWKELLVMIAPKLTGRGDRALLAAVQSFNGTPDKLAQDSKIRALLKTT